MTGQVTAKPFHLRRLSCGFALLAIACLAGRVTPVAAQTIEPPNTVFKAASVYGLASGGANVGSGTAAGGYFGNGGGTVFDVAITNGTGAGNQLFIFQSNGDGSFSLPSSGIYNFGTAVHDGLNLIVAGPVVSPSSKDLVVTDDAGELYLLKGNGDGTFQSPVSLGQTAYTLSSYLNSSGTLNLIASYLTFPTTTTTQSVVNVLANANDGTGTFTVQSVPIPVNLSVNQASALSAGGATALFIVYAGGTAALSQSVSGIFQAPVSLGNNGTPSGMGTGAISSFTWKGNTFFAGIATFGAGPAVYVWPVSGGSGGIGLGNSPSVYSIPTNDAVYVTTADLDGDGNPDLIVVGGGQFSTKQTVNLFLSGSANGFAPPQNFGNPNEILGPGAYGIQALAADANGDGKLDLLLYEPSQDLAVLLNQGSGTYLTPTTLAGGNTPTSVAKADFNGDGIDDLVVANGLNSATNTSDNTVSVFVSKAAGSFAPQVTYPVGTHPVAVTTGTVNAHLSIFALSAADTTGNFSNPVVTFLQGNGDGTFQAPIHFPTGSNTSLGAQPLAIATGIFDASGNSTVAVANSDGTINLFTYQAGAFVETSTLQASSAAPAYGLSISSLAVADVNGDGNLDLVATLRAQCGYNINTGQMVLSGGAVLIFAGNGAGAFQSPVAVTSSEANYDPASVGLGSLVTASRTDMLVMDAHGYAGGCGGLAVPNPIIFTNGGNLTFTESDLPAQFGGVTSISGALPLAAIADVNGDGLNDLVFSQNGLVSVLLQGGPGTLISIPTIYVGSSTSAGLVTGSFFAPGGHDAALASSAGVALTQSSMASVAPPPPVTVVISPSPASVPARQTVQFSDVVTGTTNTNVIWSVQAGGAGGVISGSGLYTAPAITGTDIVIATSVASPSTSASANVTITAPLPPPSVTSITPSSGPVGGGETATITGQRFQSGATVLFGATPATSVTYVSTTSLSVVVPALAAGTVDVAVRNPDGQESVLAAGFIAIPPPSITSITPSSGPVGGGETATITGQRFQSGATVLFGATPATSVTYVSTTSLSVVVPALAAGTVDVAVRNPDGQESVLAAGFIAIPPPSITSITPSSGPVGGGETATITGQRFQSGATVLFGATPATSVTYVSTTSLSVIVPALAAGTVDVAVRNPDGQESVLAAGFIAIPPPSITSITPSSGPVGGGETATITGQRFQSGATVLFGATPATSVTYVSTTSLSVVVPALAAGTVDVAVRNPDGQESVLAAGFIAIPPPSITSITPSSGPVGGGETATITGQRFQSGATVLFGATPATSVTYVSTTSLSVIVPALAAGTVDVAVRNPDGQESVLAAGFIAIPPPSITSITPSSGPVGGGETATITGQRFQSGATVLFGATPATSVTYVSTTSLSVIVPALAAGAVDVTVVNFDGQLAALAGGFVVVGPAPPPSVTLTVSETITVTDAVYVPPAVTLTGIVAPVAYYSAGSLGFVGVATGQTVTQSLILANIGLQPLAMSAEGITQDTSNSFSVTQVQCTDGAISIPDTLPTGGSCTLTISYTAPANGTPNGAITFTDNAALSNLTSTASGSSFTQSLALSTTVATTVAPPAAPTTINISISEPIKVNDQVGVVTLKTITVTPASTTIAENATEPFVATGTFSDGSTQNLTAAVTWSSSAPTVGMMSGNVATGLAYGRSTITAKLGNVSGSTTLTVLSYLTITAKLASVALDTKGEYVVKISVTNNGNSKASTVATITGLLGTKTPTSSVSATNLAPGATGTVTVVFPASAGKPLSKQTLLILGTATGSNPNGSAVVPAIWAVSTTVTLP